MVANSLTELVDGINPHQLFLLDYWQQKLKENT